MKKTSSILALLLLVYCVNANAQFGKLKDALNNAAGNLLNSKQLKLLQSDPITTNFDDCNKTETMPVNFGADSVKKKLCDLTSSYTSAQGFTLKPGFYTGTFKSFCLKAGTHGPGNGDGYLYAPLPALKKNCKNTYCKLGAAS
ncbi:hypothetical protein [Pedobacter steynii]